VNGRGSVRRDQRGRAFVATHHDLEEILRGRVGELPHAEIIEDQQRHAGDGGEVVLARATELRVEGAQ
jgi:hypothetical protein